MNLYILRKFSLLLSLFSILVVLAIDLVLPLGIADGILYVFSIILLYNERKKTVVLATIAVTMLTVFMFLHQVDANTPLRYYINRGLAVLTIWIVLMLILVQKTLQEKVTENCRVYTENLEDIMHNISHHVRTPIVRTQGISYLIEEGLVKNEEEITTILSSLKENLNYLDTYTRDLSTLVSEKKSNIRE